MTFILTPNTPPYYRQYGAYNKTVLNNAQILNLGAQEYLLIPSHGADTIIIINKIVAVFQKQNGAYGNIIDDNITIGYDNQVDFYVQFTPQLSQAVNELFLPQLNDNSTQYNLDDINGLAVKMICLNTGAFTGGHTNNKLTIHTNYTIQKI